MRPTKPPATPPRLIPVCEWLHPQPPTPHDRRPQDAPQSPHEGAVARLGNRPRFLFWFVGADGGGRTHTTSRSQDFESSASANSATSATCAPGSPQPAVRQTCCFARSPDRPAWAARGSRTNSAARKVTSGLPCTQGTISGEFRRGAFQGAFQSLAFGLAPAPLGRGRHPCLPFHGASWPVFRLDELPTPTARRARAVHAARTGRLEACPAAPACGVHVDEA